MNNLRRPFCVRKYSDSAAFLSDIEEHNQVDIAIVDIEMPIIDGQQIAKALYERNPLCPVIFLTAHTKYAVTSYELNVFRFTPKTLMEQKLPEYIKDAISRVDLQSEKYYIYEKHGKIEKIPYSDVLYISKDGKNSCFHTVNNEIFKIRQNISELLEKLDADSFFMIDRGIIINIAFIDKVSDKEIVCKNGEHLIISRGRIKEVKEKIIKFWQVI